jgi:hypothetical protein
VSGGNDGTFKEKSFDKKNQLRKLVVVGENISP